MCVCVCACVCVCVCVCVKGGTQARVCVVVVRGWVGGGGGGVLCVCVVGGGGGGGGEGGGGGSSIGSNIFMREEIKNSPSVSVRLFPSGNQVDQSAAPWHGAAMPL